MHLSPTNYIAVLLGMGVLSMAQVPVGQVPRPAIKCACSGTVENSRTACDPAGGDFNTGGCGFSGCCVYAGREQTSFIENCEALGYGFRRCDDCASC